MAAFGFYLRAAAHDPRSCLIRGFVSDAGGVPVVYGSPATTRLAAALLVNADAPRHPLEGGGPVWLEQFVRRHAP